MTKDFVVVSLDSRFRGNDTGVRFTISDSLSLRNLKWFLWIPDQVRDDKEMRKDKEVRKDKEMRNDMLTKISPFGRNDKRLCSGFTGFPLSRE